MRLLLLLTAFYVYAQSLMICLVGAETMMHRLLSVVPIANTIIAIGMLKKVTFVESKKKDDNNGL